MARSTATTTTAPAEAPARLRDARWRGLTIALVLNVTFVAFEALAIATVMPVVARELGELELYGWVFSAFLLADLVGIVVAGEVADRFGPALPLGIGLALFTIGLLVGGLAPSMPVLVAARAVQGLGAGTIPAVAYVVIGRTYPDALQPRMFAVLSTAWVVPGIAGPGLAVIVADHASWRWVFLGLLPVVLVAGGLALRELGRMPPHVGRDARHVVPDAIALAVGTALVLGGLQALHPLLTPALAAAGLIVGVPAFRRLVPAGTLGARGALPAAVLARGLLTFAFFAADVYVPLTITVLRGEGIALSGLALTGATITWTAGAWLQERTVLRYGAAPLVRNGFILVAGGIAGMGLVLVAAVPATAAVIAWGIAGFGIGMAYSSISLTVLRHASPGHEGATASAMQLSDALGTALGTGLGAVGVALAVTTTSTPFAGVALADGLAAMSAVAGIAIAGRLRG
ncbi:MAG TPA: MFS transporter [Candidatus Limnocylindria bacterium]|nr:MFS transporter [Candidatus Limnocylindria bacterium]